MKEFVIQWAEANDVTFEDDHAKRSDRWGRPAGEG